MYNKFLAATAIVLISGGLAMAQTSTGNTSTGASGGSGDATTGFSWDQSAQDAFFSDGKLRSDTETRSAWDALNPAQQEQLRTDCQSMAGADAPGAGDIAEDNARTSTGGVNADSTSESDATTGTSGGTDSGGTTNSTASSGLATGTSAENESTGTTGDSVKPDRSRMQELCTQVQSF